MFLHEAGSDSAEPTKRHTKRQNLNSDQAPVTSVTGVCLEELRVCALLEFELSPTNWTFLIKFLTLRRPPEVSTLQTWQNPRR